MSIRESVWPVGGGGAFNCILISRSQGAIHKPTQQMAIRSVYEALLIGQLLMGRHPCTCHKLQTIRMRVIPPGTRSACQWTHGDPVAASPLSPLLPFVLWTDSSSHCRDQFLFRWRGNNNPLSETGNSVSVSIRYFIIGISVRKRITVHFLLPPLVVLKNKSSY